MLFRQPPSDAQLRSLKGKSVLITGGALGLGRYAAILLAEQGAYVTIADTQPSGPVVEFFRARSLAIQYVHCDVRDWSQQVSAFKQAIAFSPRQSVDIVCSFAAVDTKSDLYNGIERITPAFNSEPQPPDVSEIDINLKGTLYTIDLALHYFRLPVRRERKIRQSVGISSAHSRDSHGGAGQSSRVKQGYSEYRSGLLAPPKSLVVVSSISGWICSPHSMYAASQFDIRGLFGGLLRDAKIKQKDLFSLQCNLIAPYVIRTPGVDATLKSIILQDISSGCKPDVKAGHEETVKSGEIARSITIEEVRTPQLDGTVDVYDPMRPDICPRVEEKIEEVPSKSPSKGIRVEVPRAASRVSVCDSTDKSGNGILTPDETFLFANTFINCCTNARVSGHAWAVTPYGVFDFKDEAETDDLAL